MAEATASANPSAGSNTANTGARANTDAKANSGTQADVQTQAAIGEPLQGSQASFGTDGIRGRVGSAITPALALQVGYWCGRVLPPEGPVLIGSDSRSSGPMLVAEIGRAHV